MSINVQKAEFILSAASPKDFRRDALPQVAFAGRSNVGKSSVINRLLNRKNFARVGAAPGKTTQINYFKIDNAFYLVDLPGYGYARVSKGERDRWASLVEGYFAQDRNVALVIQLVDMRHKPTADDLQMVDFLLQTGRPFVVVCTKSDKLNRGETEVQTALFNQLFQEQGIDWLPFSSVKGSGLEALKQVIESAVDQEGMGD